MDSHQAIYDAVRSRISGGNISEAVERAISNVNIGHYVQMALEEVAHAGRMQQRPCVLFKPDLFPDGNQWCALLGKDLQMGVAGFGDTPAEAMIAFDAAFVNSAAPMPKRS